jgi:chromosome transmission fidelity protein 18
MWQTAEQERGDERLLKQDIFMLERKAAQRREKREAQAAASAADKMVDRASGDAGRMLVDEHRPKSFVQLLSDERTNRTVLGWLKEWDPVVFPKCDRDGKRTLPFRGAL